MNCAVCGVGEIRPKLFRSVAVEPFFNPRECDGRRLLNGHGHQKRTAGLVKAGRAPAREGGGLQREQDIKARRPDALRLQTLCQRNRLRQVESRSACEPMAANQHQ
jgi:hypothetical protein